MHYLIQENIFKERNYDLLISSMEKYQLPYTIVKIFPYSDKIVNINDYYAGCNINDLPEVNVEGKVFVFGAVKIARIAKLKNYYPGTMLNANHDYEVYSQYYKDNLLNYDSKIYGVLDSFIWDDNEKFIRPTKDSKLFTGKIYKENEWSDKRIDLRNNNFYNQLGEEENIPNVQVSSCKKIYKEVRYWSIGGKIVTGSTYSSVFTTGYVDADSLEFAQKIVDLYQPADAFVIDVCLTNNGWKIVEINCINCAGFYEGSLSLILQALENLYE